MTALLDTHVLIWWLTDSARFSPARRDPADRILVATARVLGATLLTRDRRIVDAALATTLD